MIKRARFCRRPASRTQQQNLDDPNVTAQREGQDVTRPHRRVRLIDDLSIDTHLPLADGVRGKCAALKEPRMPKPFVEP